MRMKQKIEIITDKLHNENQNRQMEFNAKRNN